MYNMYLPIMYVCAYIQNSKSASVASLEARNQQNTKLYTSSGAIGIFLRILSNRPYIVHMNVNNKAKCLQKHISMEIQHFHIPFKTHVGYIYYMCLYIIKLYTQSA